MCAIRRSAICSQTPTTTHERAPFHFDFCSAILKKSLIHFLFAFNTYVLLILTATNGQKSARKIDQHATTYLFVSTLTTHCCQHCYCCCRYCRCSRLHYLRPHRRPPHHRHLSPKRASLRQMIVIGNNSQMEMEIERNSTRQIGECGWRRC
jgi:hypothetical protein